MLEAVQAGVSDYLVKPFETEGLRKKLQKFVAVASRLSNRKAHGHERHLRLQSTSTSSIRSVIVDRSPCFARWRLRVSSGKPYLAEGSQPTHEISGVIGLSGKAIGTVVLSLGEPVALKVTAGDARRRAARNEWRRVDAIGELTNMIAGSAKAQLEHLRDVGQLCPA